MATLATATPRPAPWGSPDEVFDRLTGAWLLQRTFSNGAAMRGEAVFARTASGMLAYREDGRMRLADGTELDGFREYFFERVAGGFTVHFAETPLRVFHQIEIAHRGDALEGVASHLCAADTYDSRYVFRPDGAFEIEHTVSGPRKGYVSHTVFTRG